MVKNTKYVTIDLRSGEMCYCCKSKIEIDRNELLNNILDNKTNYRICKACQRDEKLDELVNHSKLSRINKFKLFLLSEKYDKFARYLLFSLVILVFFDVTLKIVFDIKWFSPIYNLYLVCYWVLLIYRHKLISTKK